MNLIVFTGTFKKKPSLKNGVCYGMVKFDKMSYSIVAFQDTANELIKVQENELVLIEGKLQQSKYNEEWRTQIVASSVKRITTETPQSLDDIMPLDGDTEIMGDNLGGLDMPDDDLPF